MDHMSNPTVPITTGSAPEGLTQKERKLYELLSKTPTQSLWGEIIQQTIKKRDVKMFRELVGNLVDQVNEGPGGLKNIIGEEAFTLLVISFS